VKLNAGQLARHLQGALAPVYVVSGDEPLLCQEAADAIRGAARQQGYSERQVFHADAGFDWGQLHQAGASLSLFAERRLIELRIGNGKPGDKGAAALLEYLARPAEDTLLLISLPKLDGSTQKTKWAKALIDGPQCQFLQIWPVELGQLPQWIRQRLSEAGHSASAEAVDLIAARVEGNLLAAAQEIEKLKLLAENGRIEVETVQAAVADSARFDVFGLLETLLAGDAAHALRMLNGLRGEGVEALFIVASWPASLTSTARACPWTRPSPPLGRRSGTSASLWSAAPCNGIPRSAGTSCWDSPSEWTRRSRARPPATPGPPWRSCA